MPLPHYAFTTQGSWETTTLTNNNQQIDARAIYIHLCSNNWLDGGDGGLDEGVQVNEARLVMPRSVDVEENIDACADKGNFEEAFSYCLDQDIFPGAITFYVNASELTISVLDPSGDLNSLQITWEGIDITDDFCEVVCNVDAIKNSVILYLKLAENRQFNRFDVTTVTIL